MVEPGIVEPVEQVDHAGPGGGDTDADLAREFGMGTGHERRQFLVAGLNELDFAVGAVQSTHDAVDSVSGVPENSANTPVV
jgi:hypothetical protein